jgi:hypothetical protein
MTESDTCRTPRPAVSVVDTDGHMPPLKASAPWLAIGTAMDASDIEEQDSRRGDAPK